MFEFSYVQMQPIWQHFKREGENFCCRNLLNVNFSFIVLSTLSFKDHKLFCMFKLII